MPRFVDARVALRFGAGAPISATTALLVQDGVAAPEGHAIARFALPATGHLAGCACCLPRGPVAEALSRLFQARARGETGFFRDVLVLTADAAGEAAVRAALTEDAFVAARFRPA